MLQLYVKRMALLCLPILSLIAAELDAYGAGLRLEISPSQPRYRKGELVLMRASIDNMGPETVWVYSVFVPYNDLMQGPESRIAFDIVKPNGRKSVFIGMKRIFDPPAIMPNCFREMPPLSFFGQYIPLNERLFAYDLNQPGLYRVKARVRLDGNHWLQSGGPKDKKARLDFAPILSVREHVAGGELESNEVTFIIETQ